MAYSRRGQCSQTIFVPISVYLEHFQHSHRVTVDVILAAVPMYLPIAFSSATIYNTLPLLDSRSFRFPNGLDQDPLRACARR